jgi:hydroxymethylpyrimidine/phosphomethylpyrimidine kinase
MPQLRGRIAGPAHAGGSDAREEPSFHSSQIQGMTARILIIAGSDSGGGAGIQADIKTVTMLGGHAMTAVTAITAQNTLGVNGVHLIPTDMVIAQIDAVLDDIGVDAVKIGMIGSTETAHAVADRLETLDVPIVFDPVMVATSGDALADASTIAAFERLMRIASIVTPNLPELEALGGRDIVLGYGCHLLQKGGHAEGHMITDQLWSPTGLVRELSGKRFDTDDTHGTGCTLASAVACRLGQGLGIEEATPRFAISGMRMRLFPASRSIRSRLGRAIIWLRLPFTRHWACARSSTVQTVAMRGSRRITARLFQSTGTEPRRARLSISRAVAWTRGWLS